MKFCYSCFNKIEDSSTICKYCGAQATDTPVEPIHLTCGSFLAGRYVIGKAVGSGGFGIVYKAFDTKLGVIVAIKEFFVSRLATRAQGCKELIINKKSVQEFEYRKARFLAEARNMAQFGNHRSIPNVYEYFEENNTAYIVMELLKGMTLNEYLRSQGGTIDAQFAIMIANEVGKALKSLHGSKIIHRDVAPDNIFICSGKDIKIKLMDLGAAKLEDSTDDVIDIVLKPGYAPPEQYDTTKNIGPWTDVYALGATLYVMLTGVKPDESTNRKIYDDLQPVNQLNPIVSENLNNAILKAMAIEKHMRFKNVDEFLQAINGERKVVSLKKERKKRKRNRFVSVIAAMLALTVGVGAIVIDYNKKQKQAGYLNDAEITVWYIEDGANKEENLKVAFTKFSTLYEKKDIEIVIDAVGIPAEEYNQRLAEAKANGELPNLFESTGVDAGIMNDALTLDKIVTSDTFKANDVLSENYNRAYRDTTKIPMAIDVPVAVVSSKWEYEDSFFKDVSDFDTPEIFQDEDSFVSGSYNFSKIDFNTSVVLDNCSVIMTSTEQLDTIGPVFADSKYDYKVVYPENEGILCEFTFEWSVFSSSDDEDAAALMLLERMLSVDLQSNICSGRVPVEKEALPEKDKNNLIATKDIYSKFNFKEV